VSGGLTLTTAIAAYKDALYSLCQTLWPVASSTVLVSYGNPGMNQPPDIVAIMDVTSDQVIATLGNLRQREETLTCKIIVSCFRAGNADNDKVPFDAAVALLAMIENSVRPTTGDTTLGGTVRECFMTTVVSTAAADPQLLAMGRTVELEATFTAHVRVTS